jgi:hypothetical protein
MHQVLWCSSPAFVFRGAVSFSTQDVLGMRV